MRKAFTILAIFSMFCSMAQISDGGMPASFKLKKHKKPITSGYEIFELNVPDNSIIESQDKSAADKGKPFRAAVNLTANYNILNSGSWTVLENGDKIWRLGIKAQGAKALGLYLNEKLSIPKGGKLHLYNKSHSQFIGAYTHLTDGFIAFEMVQGDLITLEYYMPANHVQLPLIDIGEIAYFYRGVGDRMQLFADGRAVDNDRADACQVDVACSEITGWETQRDAVVKYTFVQGSGTFLCSGAIINNTAQDCKPYVLTANHCGEPDNSNDIQGHVWYFNYQRPTCSVANTTPYNGAQSQTMSGGLFRASSQLGTHLPSSNNQVAGSDFALLELDTSIPDTYNPYYAGWSRTTAASQSGVSIHHPSGHEKKVSTYSSSLSTSTYNNGWSGAHWRVIWVATTNGHGVTEGGSSGSPIYNTSGKIVGHLSGGASFCTAPGQPDLYGKFNRAWTQDGNNSSSQLKAWLDPINSGVTELDGTYAPCNSGGTTYCSASSVDCDEYISNITIGGVSNSSDCNNYSHYWQNQPLNLSASSSYLLEITTGIVGDTTMGYIGDQIGAWIDWNADGDFTDAGEFVYTHVIGSTTSIPLQSVITVPANANIGETRMRVRIMYDVATEGPITPCGDSNFGEVEDYQLNIGTSSLSINSSLNGTVEIYPNPTNGLLNMDLKSISSKVESITVTNTLGQQLFSIDSPQTDLFQISLDGNAKGIYFVEIKTEKGSIVNKILLK